MTLTTPAQERYTRFSCPHPHCARFNRPGEGNIAHRSWTGTHQHIERLRCTACGREFSEREGTLMARSKLPEDTGIRLVQCQRWGICDEGTADICAVDLKTVHRFQRVAAHRAETHHRQSVQNLEVPGVQLDEAHAKLRPKQVEWVHTALAMGSGFLLWVDFGPRTQATAAALIAQVVARTQALPLLLTDGWKASMAALLQVVGVVYRRRRRGKVGRKPKPRLVAPQPLFYAQVVKVRNTAGHVVEVSRRVVCGGPRRFGKPWRLRQLGTTIQTACMERWYGTLRGLVAPLRRRTRCLSWSRTRHRGKVWLVVSLYNVVLPQKSLRQGHTPRPPRHGDRPDRPYLELWRVCLAASAYRSSPHSADGRTDCTAVDSSSPGSTSWKDTSAYACRDSKSVHRRFVHSTLQTRRDYTPTRATQCANAVWSDLAENEKEAAPLPKAA